MAKRGQENPFCLLADDLVSLLLFGSFFLALLKRLFGAMFSFVLGGSCFLKQIQDESCHVSGRSTDMSRAFSKSFLGDFWSWPHGEQNLLQALGSCVFPVSPDFGDGLVGSFKAIQKRLAKVPGFLRFLPSMNMCLLVDHYCQSCRPCQLDLQDFKDLTRMGRERRLSGVASNSFDQKQSL